MEADRAQNDLGEAINAELEANKTESLKQPKKRFIGRKAAVEKAEQHVGSNRTIEDNAVVQGMRKSIQ